MYKCTHCEREFDFPAYYIQDLGEHFGFPCKEKYSCCPFCKEEDFEEVYDIED